MSNQNPNNVGAELTLAISDTPSHAAVGARGVDVTSIERVDVGRYLVELERGIPIGSLHIVRQGRTVLKGGEEPRHSFAVFGEYDAETGRQSFELWCYDLATPPAPAEDDDLISFVWHSSTEFVPVSVPLAPLLP